MVARVAPRLCLVVEGEQRLAFIFTSRSTTWATAKGKCGLVIFITYGRQRVDEGSHVQTRPALNFACKIAASSSNRTIHAVKNFLAFCRGLRSAYHVL